MSAGVGRNMSFFCPRVHFLLEKTRLWFIIGVIIVLEVSMQKSTQRKLMGGGSMILRLIAVLAALACVFCSCRSSHDDDDDDDVYTITLDANGGVFTDGEKTKTVTVRIGDSYTLPTDEPIFVGYRLLGWAATSSAEEVDCTETYTPTRDITLYAIWKLVEDDVVVVYQASEKTFVITPPTVVNGTYQYKWDIMSPNDPSAPLFSGTDKEHKFTDEEYEQLESGVYELQVTVTLTNVTATGSEEPDNMLIPQTYFTTYLLKISK